VFVTLLSVPQVVPLQPAPDRDQATPLLWGSFESVALNDLVPIPACTFAVVGETVTEIAAEVDDMVICAEADFVESVFETTVRLTAAGLGRVAGAVYVTEVGVVLLSVPQADPLQPLPETDQLTPAFFESFCTVALKFCMPPGITLAVVGETATAIAAAATVVADAVFEYPLRLPAALVARTR
jgi:hypothetical protein